MNESCSLIEYFVFSIAGMALLSFILKAKLKSGFLRGFIMVTAVVFFSAWTIAVFGILGEMFRLREKIGGKDAS